MMSELNNTSNEEAVKREYCIHSAEICLSEEDMKKALDLYLKWCRDYNQKPKFDEVDQLAYLKTDPNLVYHILTRAEVMGFKRVGC